MLQTEADPQVTSLLFDREGFQDLSERLISVAGHRVTTDPVCMPFSMGRNLFCIYSKKLVVVKMGEGHIYIYSKVVFASNTCAFPLSRDIVLNFEPILIIVISRQHIGTWKAHPN